MAKKKILKSKSLKVISGGQTGVDRGALDAALALQVACGGWCPAGRLAEDGTIPKRYPVMELANAGYAERTARNVADADGTLVISNGVLLGGTRDTVDRCVELGEPHLVIDCAISKVDEAIVAGEEFVRKLSSRAQARDFTQQDNAAGRSRGSSSSARLGRTTILNVAGPRDSQWPEGHKTAQRIVSGILRRLVDRTQPLNTVRDSPSGDP